MPSLKEIKNRIASVQSTRKITSAMKMVASSKLHHAQVAIGNMLPYEELLEHILKSFLVSMPEARTSFEIERPIKKVAILVYSSNSSLCGGFNANIIRKLIETVDEYKDLGKENILVYPIGRKVAEKTAKLGLPVAGNFTALADKPNSAQCREIAVELATKFMKGEVDRVEMIYHHFKSAGSQILTRKNFLPIDLSSELATGNDRDLSSNLATLKAQEYLRTHGKNTEGGKEIEAKPLNDDFIVEPNLKEVLSKLVPKQLHLMVYTALLDSVASEHAARMVAMQTATDNADELLRDLQLQFNKSRQQAITSELLDIVGGSANQ